MEVFRNIPSLNWSRTGWCDPAPLSCQAEHSPVPTKSRFPLKSICSSKSVTRGEIHLSGKHWLHPKAPWLPAQMADGERRLEQPPTAHSSSPLRVLVAKPELHTQSLPEHEQHYLTVKFSHTCIYKGIQTLGISKIHQWLPLPWQLIPVIIRNTFNTKKVSFIINSLFTIDFIYLSGLLKQLLMLMASTTVYFLSTYSFKF